MVCGEKLLILILLSEHEAPFKFHERAIMRNYFFVAFFLSHLLNGCRGTLVGFLNSRVILTAAGYGRGGFPDFWPRVTEIYRGWRIVRM